MPKSAQGFGETRDRSLTDFSSINLEVCQCSKCRLVQLNRNRPVSYYREVIRASAFSDEMRLFRQQQFRVFIDTHELHNKKIVEIGCGKGEYLSLMKGAGAEAHGVEYGEESVKSCVDKNLSVSRIYVEKNTEIPSAPFDAFFTLNFFEHAPDPSCMLQGIRNNLSDEAVGLVEVPNFDMMIRNNQFSEFIPDHLCYFTKDTLKATLELNGFDILECDAVWYDYIISAVVRKSKSWTGDSTDPLDLSGFIDQKNKVIKDLRNFVDKYPEGSVAVYGAGHQALAVLSMSGMGDKIKYIVDDATFKQGKFAPGSHLPIVSPEQMKKSPVEAIIVMAASYSDEVLARLRESGYNNIGLAVLRQDGLHVLKN